MTDMVNHPPHYTQHPSGVECIEITEHFNFNLGNAIKYIWRSGNKGQELHDLEKAQWYVTREIQRRVKEIDDVIDSVTNLPDVHLDFADTPIGASLAEDPKTFCPGREG